VATIFEYLHVVVVYSRVGTGTTPFFNPTSPVPNP